MEVQSSFSKKQLRFISPYRRLAPQDEAGGINTREGETVPGGNARFLLESQVRFLVTDAYSGYNRTIREINDGRKLKKLPLLHSILCNDHGRRCFFYAQEAPLAKKALDLFDQIYHIERQVQKLLAADRIAYQ